MEGLKVSMEGIQRHKISNKVNKLLIDPESLCGIPKAASLSEFRAESKIVALMSDNFLSWATMYRFSAFNTDRYYVSALIFCRCTRKIAVSLLFNITYARKEI